MKRNQNSNGSQAATSTQWKAWGNGLLEWLRLNLLLLVCMVLVRLPFFLEVYYRVGLGDVGFPTVLSGSLFDLLLVCRIFAFGLVPFLCLYRFFPKTARGIFIGLIVLYAVISALLAEYYCNLTMPLDHVILVYSMKDLQTTLSSSATVSFSQVLWFLVQVGLPVLAIVLYGKLNRENRKRHGEGAHEEKQATSKNKAIIGYSLAVLMIAAAIVVPYNRWIRREMLYPSHDEFCLAVNQPSYSFLKIHDYLKEVASSDASMQDEDLRQAIEAYHAAHPWFEYDYPEYPFYHKTNDPDVLGPFLKPTSDGMPPNLVFVIVEGLGRCMTSTPDPKLSFTPFIDSLASQGLFWPQCLSSAERTFGALPSVFASAPHGRYGFCTTLAPTPRHHSLLRDLERNGYYSSFYYGGDMAFDHYDFFMTANHVDHLFAPPIQVEDSARYQLLKQNNRWGLDDDQLVRCVIEEKTADQENRRPFVDVYLTLSTHEPFLVDHLEVYEDRVRKQVDHTPNLSQLERNNVLKNSNIFGCYLYLDDCMRTLFSYYASRPDFENTVFILTGDHRMAPLPFGKVIRKYNVPLVVYSPLLTRTKQMNAVVSHLDITPTVNAYLHANYDYAIDDHCHWLGTSLDTVAGYRNTRKLLFMLNNRDAVDYCSGDYVIKGQYLYHLDSCLMETPVEDEQLLEQLTAEHDHFDMVSRFVVQKDFLLPREYGYRLYSCQLDFDHNTLGIFENYLVKDSAFLRVGKEVEFFSPCQDLSVKPAYQDMTVEISFDIRNLDPSVPLPILTVSMGNRYFGLELDSVAGLNTGKWEHFHTRVPVEIFDMTDIEALKIRLWNKNRCEFELDNLAVQVEATPTAKDQR